MGVVTVLEELPRRSMSVCTIWTTASLISATLDRASTPARPREEYSDEVVNETEAMAVEVEPSISLM